jgi:hypothetical protein
MWRWTEIQVAEGPSVLDFQPLIFLDSFTRSLEGLAIFRADTSAKKNHKNVKSETPDLMPNFLYRPSSRRQPLSGRWHELGGGHAPRRW